MVGPFKEEVLEQYSEKIAKTYNNDKTVTITYQSFNTDGTATDNTTIRTFSQYDGPTGGKGSTTGNVYGIYDMAGGAWEYVSAYVNNEVGISATSYWTSLAPKYVNKYAVGTVDDAGRNYEANKDVKGDAVSETSTAGTGFTSWGGDHSNFPYSSSPFFIRGGLFSNRAFNGVFAFGNDVGYNSWACGFRVVLVP